MKDNTIIESTQDEVPDLNHFEKLYDKYYEVILNYLYRRTLNIEQAEELTSNTFFGALRYLEHYKHKGKFKNWLYSIATNELRMFYRKQKVRSAINEIYQQDQLRLYFDSFKTESPEARKIKFEEYQALYENLSKLPEKMQTAISLKYLEQLSYEEVAEVMGKKVNTVKSFVHRGLQSLKAPLVEEVKS